MIRKRLELEADADRKEQLREKKEIDESRKKLEAEFHKLLLADVALKARREEYETIVRNRANIEQVNMLLQQIAHKHATDKMKKESHLTMEREILVDFIVVYRLVVNSLLTLLAARHMSEAIHTRTHALYYCCCELI